jgi:hypothetical protein
LFCCAQPAAGNVVISSKPSVIACALARPIPNNNTAISNAIFIATIDNLLDDAGWVLDLIWG